MEFFIFFEASSGFFSSSELRPASSITFRYGAKMPSVAILIELLCWWSMKRAPHSIIFIVIYIATQSILKAVISTFQAPFHSADALLANSCALFIANESLARFAIEIFSDVIKSRSFRFAQQNSRECFHYYFCLMATYELLWEFLKWGFFVCLFIVRGRLNIHFCHFFFHFVSLAQLFPEGGGGGKRLIRTGGGYVGTDLGMEYKLNWVIKENITDAKVE